MQFSNENADYLGRNLKSNTVFDIMDHNIKVVDSEFTQYLYEYVDLLNDFYPNLLSGLAPLQDIDYRIRIKERGSIDGKIYRYMSEKHANGRVPINKCLNDLVGFRIILAKISHEEVDLIKEKCEHLKIKFVPRDLDEYKAIHLYFKNGNNCFFSMGTSNLGGFS